MEYSVTVSNIFEAADPEDAVKQMVAWLADYADKAGYSVETDRLYTFIDAEYLNIR